MPTATTIFTIIATVISIVALVYAHRSTRLAQTAVDHQITAYRESNTANLVQIRDPEFGRDGDNVYLHLIMHNKGPAAATNLKMTVHMPGGETFASNPILGPPALEPERVTVRLTKTFDAIDDWLICNVVFEDGNGPHELKYWLRVSGPWESEWVKGIQDTEPK
jgi:hypothetical protein